MLERLMRKELRFTELAGRSSTYSVDDAGKRQRAIAGNRVK
jgi:hypothetical protein